MPSVAARSGNLKLTFAEVVLVTLRGHIGWQYVLGTIGYYIGSYCWMQLVPTLCTCYATETYRMEICTRYYRILHRELLLDAAGTYSVCLLPYGDI